jgi:CysZ protein
MITQPVSGFGYLFRGLRIITRPGLKRFVAIPLLINILLFSAVIIYGIGAFTDLMNWMLPDWLDWLNWLLIPLFAITLLIITFYTFSLLANLISAPFNGLLAEAVEKHLTGVPVSGNSGWRAMLAQIGPTLVSELRKLGYLVLWSVPLLILFLIPGVNLIAPFVWMIFSAWMLAIEYLDYPMGNHDITFVELRARIRQKRMLSLGFGGAVMIATFIPVFNFLVMPTAVAGATAMWVDRFKGQAG